MKKLNLNIEKLTNPETEQVLTRAEERVENEILTENLEYYLATANTTEEASKVIETGFEHFTEINGKKSSKNENNSFLFVNTHKI
jgi:hypothetical protein